MYKHYSEKKNPEHLALFNEKRVKSEHFTAHVLHIFSPVSFSLISIVEGMFAADSQGAKLFSIDIFKGMSFSHC